VRSGRIAGRTRRRPRWAARPRPGSPQPGYPARLRALPAGTAELRVRQRHDAVAGDPRRGCSGVRDHLARFRGNAVMPARLRRWHSGSGDACRREVRYRPAAGPDSRRSEPGGDSPAAGNAVRSGGRRPFGQERGCESSC